MLLRRDNRKNHQSDAWLVPCEDSVVGGGGMKMISLIAVALLLAATSAYAQTSSKYKVSLYKSCQEACVEKQIKAAANKPFLDVPFVFEHYCGCYCSRFAMRLSVEDAEVLARMALEGKSVESNKRIREQMDAHSKVCMGVFFN